MTTLTLTETRMDLDRRRYEATVTEPTTGRRFTIVTSIVGPDTDGGHWIGYHVTTEDGRVAVNSDLREVTLTPFPESRIQTALWAAASEAEGLLRDWLDIADAEAHDTLLLVEVGPCAAEVDPDCTGLGTAYAGRCLPCDLALAAREEALIAEYGPTDRY